MTTHASRLHARWPDVNPWMVAVVLLAAALIGLTMWVIIDKTTSTTTEATTHQALASESVAKLLEERLTLMNTGRDWKAFEALFTKTAVLEERDQTPAVVTRGAEQIAMHQQTYWQMGMRIDRESPIIQFGPYAAYAVSMRGMPDWAGMGVFEMTSGGKIAHQWVLGG